MNFLNAVVGSDGRLLTCAGVLSDLPWHADTGDRPARHQPRKLRPQPAPPRSCHPMRGAAKARSPRKKASGKYLAARLASVNISRIIRCTWSTRHPPARTPPLSVQTLSSRSSRLGSDGAQARTRQVKCQSVFVPMGSCQRGEWSQAPGLRFRSSSRRRMEGLLRSPPMKSTAKKVSRWTRSIRGHDAYRREKGQGTTQNRLRAFRLVRQGTTDAPRVPACRWPSATSGDPTTPPRHGTEQLHQRHVAEMMAFSGAMLSEESQFRQRIQILGGRLSTKFQSPTISIRVLGRAHGFGTDDHL